MPSVVRLLRDLIAIPSVNPAFLPAGDPRAGEEGMARYVGDWGGKEGWDVEFQEVLPGRRNVWLRCLPTEDIRHRVLLAPHMDTVGSFAGGDGVYRPRMEGGRVWGRGACDTKGSLAAMLIAMQEWWRGGRGKGKSKGEGARHTEVCLVGLVDEESHQQGSRAVVSAGFRADLGVVGEPTGLKVMTAHKGDVWARLTVKGRAAHGSCPERGINAIRRMAGVVEALEGEYAEQLRQRRHPLLGSPTINVGTIHGGRQANVVPDACEVVVDRRMLPGEGPEGVRREILSFLKERGHRVVWEDVKGVPEPALETEEGNDWVRAFLRSCGCRRGRGAQYFCDAAVLAMGGTPCVVFGPGNIAQAHTEDEWVAVEQLEGAVARLGRFLEGLP